MTDPAKTIDQDAGEPADSAEPDEPTESRDAADVIARYRHGLRRQRIWYAAVVAVVVVIASAFVGVMWSRGEAAHVTLHTVARPPVSPGLGVVSNSLRPAWRTTDRIALGNPIFGGTVVTYDTHTVRGRNALTGQQTWSYNRSDRTVCAAIQFGGTAIAIYRLNGNCDEISAFAAGTGVRAWTRTLDIDGQPFNGEGTYQWSLTGPTLMITQASVIYGLSPSDGGTRFTYTRFGCRINSAVLGSAGALISQTCTNPRCTGLKYCGNGPQLLLRNGTEDKDDKSSDNRDRIMWNRIGDTDVPAAAGTVIAAVNRTTRQLDSYRSNGKSSGTIALSPRPSTITNVTGIEGVQSQLVWIDGVSYLLQTNAGSPAWATRTEAVPTVASGIDKDVPTLDTEQLSVPTSSGIALLDGGDGSVARRFTVPAPPPGSQVTRLGTGFLVSTPSGGVVYQ